MSATTARLTLRPTRQILSRRAAGSRCASTTSDAASKAKETASAVTSKASEGLSKVKSSAEGTLSTVTSASTDAAKSAQGRIGGIVARVQSGRAWAENGTSVSQTPEHTAGQSSLMMIRSNLSTIQSYVQPLSHAIRNPSTLPSLLPSAVTQPQQLLGSVRNMNTSQMVGVGIILAEVVGFFTIGEMIGKLKIVGYRGETGAHH
ncbi:hypothetical protein MRB53_040343 [Persea americana]|nr:hypothetical protein MRB53_040343 [Persea americana]